MKTKFMHAYILFFINYKKKLSNLLCEKTRYVRVFTYFMQQISIIM
jgi:hypothetical protein